MAEWESFRGIGVDLVEVERVTQAVKRWGQRFLERVFNPTELAYCLPKALPFPHLAARLAAKEAAYKALATPGLSWRDFWVENVEGLPCLCCSERVKRQCGSVQFQLSLSHTRQHAVAMVMARW